MVRKYLRSILLLTLLSAFISCNKSEKKDDDKLLANAIIIEFNQVKCKCCWGWKIQMGNEIITTNSTIVGEEVGYIITEPIHVYIELGEQDKDCPVILPSPNSILGKFEIKKIKMISKDE